MAMMPPRPTTHSWGRVRETKSRMASSDRLHFDACQEGLAAGRSRDGSRPDARARPRPLQGHLRVHVAYRTPDFTDHGPHPGTSRRNRMGGGQCPGATPRASWTLGTCRRGSLERASHLALWAAARREHAGIVGDLRHGRVRHEVTRTGARAADSTLSRDAASRCTSSGVSTRLPRARSPDRPLACSFLHSALRSLEMPSRWRSHSTRERQVHKRPPDDPLRRRASRACIACTGT